MSHRWASVKKPKGQGSRHCIPVGVYWGAVPQYKPTGMQRRDPCPSGFLTDAQRCPPKWGLEICHVDD